MSSHIENQVDFCKVLMDRLKVNTRQYEKAKGKKGFVWAGENVPLYSGASKCQLQDAIIRLRRELLILGKLINGEEETDWTKTN